MDRAQVVHLGPRGGGAADMMLRIITPPSKRALGTFASQKKAKTAGSPNRAFSGLAKLDRKSVV